MRRNRVDFLNSQCDALFEHCGDLVIFIDHDCKIVAINSVAENTLNVLKKDVVGKNLFAVCASVQTQLSFNEDDLKKKKFKNEFVDGYIKYLQEQKRFMLWKQVVVQDEGSIVFGKDVTAFENVKKNSLLTTAHLRSIMENLPEYIYWKDLNLTYCGCNKHVSDYLNLPAPESIIGKTDKDFGWSKERIQTLHEIDKQIIRTGIPSIVEDIIPKPDKTHRVMLSSKTPLRDANNKIVGIVGISVDITDRKNAAKLQAEKEATEKVLRAVEMLSGCIAHEIRTPLAIIGINVDNLHRELTSVFAGHSEIEFDEASTEQKNRVEKLNANIKFAVHSASNIVNMLLIKIRNIFDKQSDDKKLEPSQIKLCVDEAIDGYPFYNNERELVVWDGAAYEDFTYAGNNLLTKHILFNLIKNSLAAIKEAGRGKIYISLEQKKKYNCVIFKDTASGVPAKIYKSLFDQFNSSSKEGAGLGLAFCKMTMQSYGGDITCDSKAGEYTEFTMSFPKV